MRIAAELHCHTYHSDARFSPAELAECAKDAGLDLIALTDHNTMSGYREMAETGLPFIRGIEWTTFFGHMVVLGQKKFVDWRDAEIGNIDEKIDQIHAAGGLAGIAHPFDLGSPFCTGCHWDYAVQRWENVDYMEVWHSSGIPSEQIHNRRARKLWLSLLDQGYRITPVMGRDWHWESVSPEPNAVTYLEADAADEASALKALAEGRTLLSIGPDLRWRLSRSGKQYAAGDEIDPGEYLFEADADLECRKQVWKRFGIRIDRILLYAAGERILASISGERGSILCTPEHSDRFVRVEAEGVACGRPCRVCLSAPIWIR